jgi:hypothetical protein
VFFSLSIFYFLLQVRDWQYCATRRHAHGPRGLLTEMAWLMALSHY